MPGKALGVHFLSSGSVTSFQQSATTESDNALAEGDLDAGGCRDVVQFCNRAKLASPRFLAVAVLVVVSLRYISARPRYHAIVHRLGRICEPDLEDSHVFLRGLQRWAVLDFCKSVKVFQFLAQQAFVQEFRQARRW